MSTKTERVVTSPRRGEARTQAILDATIELIAEVGFDSMTVDSVAARARASKATIYRRWPNKNALTLDAVRRRSSVVHSLRETGSLRGDLELYLREAIGGTDSIDGPLVAGLLTVAAHDPELAALLGKQFHDQQVPTLAALLDRARTRHEVGPDVDAYTIAELLPGALIMHMIVLGQPGDDAFVRQLLDEVLLPLLERTQPRPAHDEHPAQPTRAHDRVVITRNGREAAVLLKPTQRVRSSAALTRCAPCVRERG